MHLVCMCYVYVCMHAFQEVKLGPLLVCGDVCTCYFRKYE
jgi:hypothetical protein